MELWPVLRPLVKFSLHYRAAKGTILWWFPSNPYQYSFRIWQKVFCKGNRFPIILKQVISSFQSVVTAKLPLFANFWSWSKKLARFRNCGEIIHVGVLRLLQINFGSFYVLQIIEDDNGGLYAAYYSFVSEIRWSQSKYSHELKINSLTPGGHKTLQKVIECGSVIILVYSETFSGNFAIGWRSVFQLSLCVLGR